MIHQCKGKDLNKVPKSRLGDLFFSSIKYDGHYVQIHKFGNEVKFFTSGGKEFYHELAAEEILSTPNQHNYVLEAEFIAHTEGKLGSRGEAAKLTTYRTNFVKGLANVGLSAAKDRFKVFDTIIIGMNFEDRLHWIKESLTFGKLVDLVDYSGPDTLEVCKDKAALTVKQGYEGLYLKAPTHLYKPGKRVNDAIKLKLRPTTDLMCVGIEDGEGKYEGKIGSLLLQDKMGRVVRVGSGLSDSDRDSSHATYIGQIIEIEYEQILSTYIQPTFVCIREDKTETD